MADNNTATPSNPFQGVTFDTNAINALGSKATQALPNLNGLAAVLPYQHPSTWTPLSGGWDAVNAGLGQTAGGVTSVKFAGAIEKLSGGLGLANDAVAVGQHLPVGDNPQWGIQLASAGGIESDAGNGLYLGDQGGSIYSLADGQLKARVGQDGNSLLMKAITLDWNGDGQILNSIRPSIQGLWSWRRYMRQSANASVWRQAA
jgi:hypothetical protein